MFFKVLVFALMAAMLIHSSARALEMSSKRDCAICHVMWIDDFRTNQETLIEWQPGNVLMKDTQGVVSSEGICYSCHDGFVNDSRHTVWSNNRHKIFVKPSKNIVVPTGLPLSVKDELYCGTCHSAHSAGAAPDVEGSRMTSFFREKNIDSSLCELCHRNELDYRRTNSHPVHTTTLNLPDLLFERGGTAAKNRNSVICESCHKVHGAQGEKILITDNKDSRLCIMCHIGQSSIIATKHDLRVTLPEERNVKGQPLSETGPCGACHIAHHAAGTKLWARDLQSGNAASLMCLTCHGEHTTYRTTHTGKHSHPVNIKAGSRESLSADLPLFSPSGLRSTEGRIQCLTCHDAHRWNPAVAEKKGEKDEEGTAENSFLRVGNNVSSTLCVMCHTDKKQIMTSDHNLEITASEEKNIQGLTTRESGPCGACHIPHNAAGSRLWARAVAPGEEFVLQTCTGCHRRDGSAKEKRVGENDHPVLIPLADDMPVDFVAASAEIPLYDAGGKRDQQGKIACGTCHDPHTWRARDPAPEETYARENKEGDAASSFLRKANSPSSALCVSCHTEQALVHGTDHDLTVTAPEAKNLLGQSINESGPCGACHLAHHSPHQMRLWARSVGAIDHDGSRLDGLCTGCHSKGGSAEKKTPPVATHPGEMMITNSETAAKANRYTPVFDKEGRESLVGYLACPSCHDAHRWTQLSSDKGANQNLEGNTTTSFLRSLSYRTICSDCHGIDALFRYQYFHVPEKRRMEQASK